MSNKIVLTGGGTAGHVMLHIALLDQLKKNDWEPIYIGSDGIEKNLIEPIGIPFKTIAAGKLRRYFSWQNFTDIFKVLWGTIQAFFLLAIIRPKLVFSKGGFVSVPVAVAAWLLRIPVITHESDVTPGLANKIILKFTRKMLYSFPETGKYLPKLKSELVGSVIRRDLLTGNPESGMKFTRFTMDDPRPVLMVMGGSQGSQLINDAIKENYDDLTKTFRVIHLTGKGKTIGVENSSEYVGFEFVNEELKHLFSIADIVVSRSGANSIFELLALKKPMLLVPLEKGSRGDQVVNAESFVKQNWAHVIKEDELSPQSFLAAIKKLEQNVKEIRKCQGETNLDFSGNRMIEIFNQYRS